MKKKAGKSPSVTIQDKANAILDKMEKLGTMFSLKRLKSSRNMTNIMTTERERHKNNSQKTFIRKSYQILRVQAVKNTFYPAGTSATDRAK